VRPLKVLLNQEKWKVGEAMAEKSWLRFRFHLPEGALPLHDSILESPPLLYQRGGKSCQKNYLQTPADGEIFITFFAWTVPASSAKTMPKFSRRVCNFVGSIPFRIAGIESKVYYERLVEALNSGGCASGEISKARLQRRNWISANAF
jgi:hypothetical protein